jgi:hypothetical protein
MPLPTQLYYVSAQRTILSWHGLAARVGQTAGETPVPLFRSVAARHSFRRLLIPILSVVWSGFIKSVAAMVVVAGVSLPADTSG